MCNMMAGYHNMRDFIYDQAASRVVFGTGSIKLIADEVKRLGAGRAMVLSTPEQRASAEEVSARLGDLAAGVFAEAVMHVPIETARKARETAARLNAGCYVAIGGGSTIGLGKAIALESGLPILAIPTTYAGSEMTPIWGLTEGGVKKTGRDRKVLPRTVVYDPLLTLTLPPRIAGPSGMNAIAHCVEGLYAYDGNPIISLFAAEGIRALARSLPIVVRDPGDIAARSDALYGAWLAGTVLGAVSIGIHHKLCHTLGGTFNLPHAEVHTVILPHAIAFNRDAAPGAMRIVADALGVQDAAQGIYDLAATVGAPLSLKDIGMPEDGLERAADLATRNPYPNPRPVEYAGVLDLLRKAYAGVRPE
jgi:maleylacetate reductase